jgi:hypothetical protein
MILQIGLSNILLKLLIEEERVETTIVLNPAFAAVVMRAAQAGQNCLERHLLPVFSSSYETTLKYVRELASLVP